MRNAVEAIGKYVTTKTAKAGDVAQTVRNFVATQNLGPGDVNALITELEKTRQRNRRYIGWAVLVIGVLIGLAFLAAAFSLDHALLTALIGAEGVVVAFCGTVLRRSYKAVMVADHVIALASVMEEDELKRVALKILSDHLGEPVDVPAD